MAIKFKTGYRVVFPSVGALAISEVEIDEVGEDYVKLKIIKVGAGVIRMMIGYRIRKQRNVDALSFTTIKSDPAVDEIFTITGLDTEKLYEFIPYSMLVNMTYNMPGPILMVTPSASVTSVRDICVLVQSLMQAELNAQLDVQAALRGEDPYPHFLDRQIKDTDAPVTIEDPLMRIVATEAIVEKTGDRKIWNYTVLVDISIESQKLDADQLQRRCEIYMIAGEAVVDANENLGGGVWEAQVNQITYPAVESEGEDENQLTQSGILHIRVDQTN